MEYASVHHRRGTTRLVTDTDSVKDVVSNKRLADDASAILVDGRHRVAALI